MELKSTIDYMTSKDYKERFLAEYWQTKIRYEKLKDFCTKIEAIRLKNCDFGSFLEEPKHDCPYELLREQQRIMGEYLHTLELRAVIEEIDLNSFCK